MEHFFSFVIDASIKSIFNSGKCKLFIITMVHINWCDIISQHTKCHYKQVLSSPILAHFLHNLKLEVFLQYRFAKTRYIIVLALISHLNDSICNQMTPLFVC